jgi:hypothetical protein
MGDNPNMALCLTAVAVGLFVGLAYSLAERGARISYRARLFLKNTTAVWASRRVRGEEFVEGPAPSWKYVIPRERDTPYADLWSP